MKIVVVRLDGNGPDVHEGDWVANEVSASGVLMVNVYDEHDAIVYWEVYANGAWASFKQVEPPSVQTARRRGIAEQQNASRPRNGGTFACQ